MNILRNPHFIFDVHVTEVVEASLYVISQTLMDACTKTEHKLSRVSFSLFCFQQFESQFSSLKRYDELSHLISSFHHLISPDDDDHHHLSH